MSLILQEALCCFFMGILDLLATLLCPETNQLRSSAGASKSQRAFEIEDTKTAIVPFPALQFPINTADLGQNRVEKRKTHLKIIIWTKGTLDFSFVTILSHFSFHVLFPSHTATSSHLIGVHKSSLLLTSR